MNLCSKNHDEVAFDGRNCPVCQVVDEKNAIIQERDDTIEDLNLQIKEEQELTEEHQTKIKELQAEVERLCSGVLDGER